jgi:predicted PurR-regulated permease PerM
LTGWAWHVNDNPQKISSDAIVDLIVQLACVALLAVWAAFLLQPFFTIIAWSVILAVILYPFFDWMVRVSHMPALLAALLLTAICLAILLGPTAWLGVSLVETLQSIAERLRSGVAVPPPPESIKTWPLIGDQAYDFWSLASSNLREAFGEIGPYLKSLSGNVLSFAGSTTLGMIEFLAAVIIAGFLLSPGPRLVEWARSILRRITARRGDEFVDLIGVTVRNLARGVIGVAIVQALLAGIAFIIVGVPAAGFLSLLVLIFGIAQIGAGIVIIPIVIWSWLTLNTTTALIFTVCMIPVILLENVLRPIIMAHGLKTPMIVILIGVIGGILTHGVIGVFLGPVVLAIAWELLTAWGRKAEEQDPDAAETRR